MAISVWSESFCPHYGIKKATWVAGFVAGYLRLTTLVILFPRRTLHELIIRRAFGLQLACWLRCYRCGTVSDLNRFSPLCVVLPSTYAPNYRFMLIKDEHSTAK